MSPPRKKGKKEEVALPPPDGLHSGDIRFTRLASPVFVYEEQSIKVGGVRWKASVSYNKPPEKGRAKSKPRQLDVSFSSAMHNRSPLWSIFADVTFTLVNADSSENIVKNQRRTFNGKTEHLKMNLITWNDLIDERKGFVQDGKFKVLVNFSIIKKTGFKSLPPPPDFTDPNEPNHDIALVIEGQKIYASKKVLAICSPVFHAMFYGHFDEKNKKEIELKEIDREDFIVVLNLMYRSCQEITDDNTEPILIIADRYQIQAVTAQVEEFLISRGSSMIDLPSKIRLANDYRLAKLQKSFNKNERRKKMNKTDSNNAEDISRLEITSQIDFTDPNEPLHDVALVIGGEKIYANKQYLSLQSPVFKGKFDRRYRAKKKYELCDLDREEFLEMLRVIYPTGQKITDNNMRFLLKLGHRFDINLIRELVENHLISSSNLELSGKLLLSERHKFLELQGQCIDEVYEHGRMAVMGSVEYKDLFDELKKVMGI